jgi:hypothetical protein
MMTEFMRRVVGVAVLEDEHIAVLRAESDVYVLSNPGT